ncbi:hypothetical protein WJX72_010036 [[Myrmecia] bisecta]|uniref:Rab-GAP TBC domain-containing protein n=1 Tax=[Myrmecia] bisecta TaxID=41462 RepID=A0AAW1QG31_9CHLO
MHARLDVRDQPVALAYPVAVAALQRRGAGTAAAKQYTKLLLKPIQPETAADIEKDVGRTFPNLRRFSTPEGRRSLEMVLRAYAASDPEVGYCQGMNFLAGVLLAWLPADADAFGGLVVLMQERELRQLYTTDLAMLQVRLWQIGKLMPPQLAHHMEMHGALPVLYASSWLLTAFASDFPLSFASRVMDVILTDNYTAAMMKVVLGILRHCEAALLAMTDMEQMVDYLKMEVPCLPRETLHELLTDALKAPWTPRQAAILEQVSGAETVVDAVRRVDRMSSGEEPTLAETPSLPIAPTAYHLTALPPPARPWRRPAAGTVVYSPRSAATCARPAGMGPISSSQCQRQR